MQKLFKALLKPGDQLFGRAMSAGLWAGLLQVALRGAVLTRTVILARLLAPDDFGLMALAMLGVLLVDGLTQSGFDSALVQRKGDIEPYLDTAWTLQVVRGAAMGLVVAMAAPWIGQFFGSVEAIPIIRVMALVLVIQGFVNIAVVYFIKDLRFDLRFKYELSAKGTDVVVSIIAAVILRNVWALVFGLIAGAVVQLIASYVIHPYRPHLRWVQAHFRIMFGFGKWVFATNFIGYLIGYLDDILVGRVLGVTALGWYRMAYNFSQAVASEIGQVVNQVSFPTFSILQDAQDRLRAAYVGALHAVAFLAFPIAIGTILVASDLTLGVLGVKWLPIVTAMQLLSIAGLARALGATTGPLFEGSGRPDINTKFSVVRLAMLAGLLYPAIEAYGIDGAAGVVAVSAALVGSAALVLSFRRLGVTGATIVQAIGYPAFHAGVMAVVVVTAKFLLFDGPSLASFLVLVAIGAVSYFAAVGVSVRFLGYAAPNALVERLRGLADERDGDVEQTDVDSGGVDG